TCECWRTSGALAGPFLLWRIAETGKRHASNAPASLSLKVSRFVPSSVPPTGADKGRVQSECPHLAVPFIVTNRAGNEAAPVMRRWFVLSLPRATLAVGGSLQRLL